ncbi:DUF2934 domain-containing protein [Rhizobium cremeum]|uniref:DUF2934 domain-containing protein n=1 Tax=Rhizobium cremeum TaxID=2813827 RepID=UPI000DDD27A4
MDERSREERIRQRAYELWEAEGRIDGHHERHWHDASAELEQASAISEAGEQADDAGASAAAPKVKSRSVRPSKTA